MSKNSKKLLLDEPPMVIIPSLAKQIGLNEAIVLQQVHYWLELNRKTNKNYRDGHYWTYNTLNGWQDQFSWWTTKTISRIFTSLKKQGLIITSNYNKMKIDRTNWYRIDYDVLDNLTEDTNNDEQAKKNPTTEGSIPLGQNVQMEETNCPNGSGQNVQTITRDSETIYTDNNNRGASQDMEISKKEAAATTTTTDTENNDVVVVNYINNKTTKTAPTQNIEANTDVSGDNDKVQLLISYGVTKSKARDLAKKHNLDYIKKVIHHSSSEARNNQGGYIVRALQENWNFTKGKPPVKTQTQPPRPKPYVPDPKPEPPKYSDYIDANDNNIIYTIVDSTIESLIEEGVVEVEAKTDGNYITFLDCNNPLVEAFIRRGKSRSSQS